MSIATINPTTGATDRMFEAHSDAEVDKRLSAAAGAFDAFRRSSFVDRARWMVAAAELLEGELPDIAQVLTTEMGKTFAAAKGEVAKSARTMRYFAQHAAGMLADESVPEAGLSARVAYRPLGPVLAVMPWNFPLWQVVRFAAPALMAGNVGLLKHASNVPQTALLIEDVFRRAGFPEGVFQTLLVDASRVSRLVSDQRVKAVTLTGSDLAGASVASEAGRSLKKSVLELGGSDPFLVMPSADLQRAVATGVEARIQNNGQSCIAAKRFIIHDDVYEQFEQAMVEAMERLTVGDPMEPATELGPLATEQGRSTVQAQVDDARAKGARVLCGGEPIGGAGFFYPPTVLAGLDAPMRVFGEEVFGPVAMLYRVGDAGEALALANSSVFGLGASIWTEDPVEQALFQEELEAGMVFTNAPVASMPELPFGGVKRSGYGRELGLHGLREFCAVKTLWSA